MSGFTCRTCGQHHPELPMAYGSPAPAFWFGIPERERAKRCALTDDQCVVDGAQFFMAGNLEIPVAGLNTPFCWTVWASVSEATFRRATEMWDVPGREDESPYFGWLDTALPSYPDTLGLKVNLHTRPVGVRPYVEVEPTSHPLAVEQREGMTLEHVEQIAEMLLHGGGRPAQPDPAKRGWWKRRPRT